MNVCEIQSFSTIFDIFEDIESALEPLSMQIADVEENIDAIVEKNEAVHKEIQGMKTDINSLSDKITAIKVSLIFQEGMLIRER